jgi:hypothetical protein
VIGAYFGAYFCINSTRIVPREVAPSGGYNQ